jgi:hypothetical protein
MVGKKSYKKHKGGTTEAAAAQAGEVSIFGAMKAQAAKVNAGLQNKLQDTERKLGDLHTKGTAAVESKLNELNEIKNKNVEKLYGFTAVARGHLQRNPDQNVAPTPGQGGGRKKSKRSSKRSSKRRSSKTKKRVRFSFKRSKSMRSKSKRRKH